MIRCGITTTPKILVYLLIHPGTTAPVPRALARRAPLLGRRAPVVGRRDRVALAGIAGGGIEATRAGAWLPRRTRPGGRRLRCRLSRDRRSRRRAALLVGGGALGRRAHGLATRKARERVATVRRAIRIGLNVQRAADLRLVETVKRLEAVVLLRRIPPDVPPRQVRLHVQTDSCAGEVEHA